MTRSGRGVDIARDLRNLPARSASGSGGSLIWVAFARRPHAPEGRSRGAGRTVAAQAGNAGADIETYDGFWKRMTR